MRSREAGLVERAPRDPVSPGSQAHFAGETDAEVSRGPQWLCSRSADGRGPSDGQGGSVCCGRGLPGLPFEGLLRPNAKAADKSSKTALTVLLVEHHPGELQGTLHSTCDWSQATHALRTGQTEGPPQGREGSREAAWPKAREPWGANRCNRDEAGR